MPTAAPTNESDEILGEQLDSTSRPRLAPVAARSASPLRRAAPEASSRWPRRASNQQHQTDRAENEGRAVLGAAKIRLVDRLDEGAGRRRVLVAARLEEARDTDAVSLSAPPRARRPAEVTEREHPARLRDPAEVVGRPERDVVLPRQHAEPLRHHADDRPWLAVHADNLPDDVFPPSSRRCHVS